MYTRTMVFITAHVSIRDFIHIFEIYGGASYNVMEEKYGRE